MTLIEITNHILNHLLACSTFNLEEDLDAIPMDKKKSGTDLISNKRDIVKCALDEMVKANLLRLVKDGMYILVKPLGTIPQNVMISPMTAMMIADLINSFTKVSGEMEETGYITNKLDITDYDIQKMCQICHMILSSDGDEISIEESEEDGEQEANT